MAESAVKCVSCHNEKEPKWMQTKSTKGRNGQKEDKMICNDCNSLLSRVNRYVDANQLKSPLPQMTPEGRQQFMSQHQDKFQTALGKVLTEAITAVSLTKNTKTFIASGEFVDYQEAAEDYSDRPEEWANITANARTFECPVRKALMIAIPKYNWKAAEEAVESIESKRKLEQVQEIKRAKKIKVEKRDPANAEAGEGAEDKPILEKQLTRIAVLKTKMDVLTLKIAAILSTAEAPELEEYVSSAAKKKGNTIQKQLKDLLTHIFLNLGSDLKMHKYVLVDRPG